MLVAYYSNSTASQSTILYIGPSTSFHVHLWEGNPFNPKPRIQIQSLAYKCCAAFILHSGSWTLSPLFRRSWVLRICSSLSRYLLPHLSPVQPLHQCSTLFPQEVPHSLFGTPRNPSIDDRSPASVVYVCVYLYIYTLTYQTQIPRVLV